MKFNSAKQACHIITSIYHKITPLIGKGTILSASDISQTRRLVSMENFVTQIRLSHEDLRISDISDFLKISLSFKKPQKVL